MKNKDTQLLEEAYQQVFEANFLTKAIDKSKEMLGMGPSKPLTFDQAKPMFVQALQKLGLNILPMEGEGVAAEWEEHASPWWLSKEKNAFVPGGYRGQKTMVRPNNFSLPDITKNENGQNQYMLTDKNLNDVIKQTKDSISLTKKAIEQNKKDAPEREKSEKEFQNSQEQARKDAFWAQRARSYQDTKSSEDTAKLIGKQRGY